MPTVQDFRDYIQYTKSKAADQGVKFLEMSSEGIHQCVAGKADGFHHMTECLVAMEAERGPQDKTVRSRYGTQNNLTILYLL